MAREQAFYAMVFEESKEGRAYREASAESQRELGPIQEAYLSALKRVAAETSAEETVN